MRLSSHNVPNVDRDERDYQLPNYPTITGGSRLTETRKEEKLRRSVTFICLVIAVVCASAAMAGDYHYKDTLECTDCHSMHYSATHDYTGGAAIALEPGGPHGPLLKGSVNGVCLTCHDGQVFAPDVYGASGNGYVREAGGLTTGVAPYEDYKGHTLGSTETAPGGTFNNPDGLECVDCHAQHGQTPGVVYPTGYTHGQWRNLQVMPGSATAAVQLTYATGTNDPTKDVFERDATLGQIATHYSVDNVQFNEPDPAKSSYAEWCKGCHTDFHGLATDTNMNDGDDWLRHPTAGVNVGESTAEDNQKSNLSQYKSHVNQTKVLVGAGADDYTPSCMSCHKAHGNQNPFGLIYMGGTGTVTEQGDDGTQVKNLCQQCHIQGTE